MLTTLPYASFALIVKTVSTSGSAFLIPRPLSVEPVAAVSDAPMLSVRGLPAMFWPCGGFAVLVG